MKIFICDDDKGTLDFLRTILTKHYGKTHQIFTFANPNELLRFGTEPDLLLSDIKLNDTNGIDICRDFLNKYPKVKIIFITGYPTEFYEEIFNYFRPYGFIGKPIQETLLFKRIDNINRILQSNQKIEFLCKGTQIFINPNNIIYIESHGRQKFITTEKDIYIINLSFDDIEKMLPCYFTRSHNAFIVNLNYISSYKNDNIVITNGKILPIGRKYKQRFKDSYFTHKEKENADFFV